MNHYFNWPGSAYRFVSADYARAEDVNRAFDGVSTGFDQASADIARSLKLPAGTSNQVLNMPAGQRAGLVLCFDAQGNVTARAVGGRYMGDWAAGRSYAQGDMVRDAATQNVYAVLRPHTSGASLAADVAAGNLALVHDMHAAVQARDVAQAASAAARQSQTQAAASATAAQTSAQSALGAAAAALASQTAAQTARTAASTSQTAAAASAELAQKWATQTNAEVVAGQGYGARKYALDAARSAADAAAATRLPGPSGQTGRVLASDGANVVWKLPVFPVDGATQGTLSRDAQGRLTGASLKLDDKPLVYAMQRDAQGRLQQVSATYDGYKRAVNLSRDAQGRLTSFTGEKTHV